MAGSKLKKNDVQSTIDEIEEENMRTLGDIPVDENGYAHDELLAGYEDEDGVVHTEFAYREMNGKDEEAISKPEIRGNSAKVVNVLVERCVVSIGTYDKKTLGAKKWGDLVRKLLGGDLDYIILKIRELSKGKEIKFNHVCPNCKSKLTTIVDTDEFEIIPYTGMSEIPFSLPRGYLDKDGNRHTDGTIRLMNGLDREIMVPIFRKNEATGTTMMFTRLVKFNDGLRVTNDVISSLGLMDREYLEELVKENVFGVDTRLDLECNVCGESLAGEIGTSNFF